MAKNQNSHGAVNITQIAKHWLALEMYRVSKTFLQKIVAKMDIFFGQIENETTKDMNDKMLHLNPGYALDLQTWDNHIQELPSEVFQNTAIIVHLS